MTPAGVCRVSDVVLPALVLSVVLLQNKGLTLDLRGKPASQSTTYNSIPASRAIDGDTGTWSHTMRDVDQWWKVDLEAIYCLKKITVINAQHCSSCARRLRDAVVRAGLSSDHLQNAEIGDAITEAEALAIVIEFVVDPVVPARYVSVDRPRWDYLHLAEVMVEEIQDTEETSSGQDTAVDFTLVAHPARLGSAGDDTAVIQAYKGPSCASAGIIFGRQLDTGGGNVNLPAGSTVVSDHRTRCNVTLSMTLPESDGLERTGVFYSDAVKNEIVTRIQTVILNNDDSTTHTRPAQRTQTASIGELVVLRMENVNSPNSDYRWRHDAGDFITAWHNQLIVNITSVTVDDGGTYSCHVLNERSRRLHGFTRLIVRGCAAGMWGSPACQNTCHRCYNGGICDDKTGTCVCAPGFSGEYCHQVHGRHVFGQSASHTCSDSTDPHNAACQGRLFCLPDPYGCSCAAGYVGLDCMQECLEGTYGADCKQICHCPTGESCQMDTGICSGNCVPPYFGSNCQCSTGNGVLGLKVASTDPSQLSVSWQPDPCVSGYTLEYALTNRGQCEEIAAPQRVTLPGPFDGQTTGHLITALIPRSSYTVYIRPKYNGTQGPEASASGTTLEDDSPSVDPVVVTSYDSASVTLSWRRVYCANYSVRYALKDKEGCQPIDSPSFVQHCTCSGSTSTTIRGLFANSLYEIQVQANVEGSHGPITPTNVTTGSKEPSAPPQHIHVTATLQRVLSFSWSPPACGTRGGALTGYSYQLFDVKSGAQVAHSFTSHESVTIGGLVPFSEYSFRVVAHTSAGAGPGSESEVARTLEAEPTVPLNVVIRNVDDVSITLQWSEPDPPQGIITHYNIKYWRSGQSGDPTLISDVVQLAHEITGLQTNVAYHVQVQAETGIGEGPWSVEVIATTEIGEPGPVRTLHWTDRSDTAITLVWEPPLAPNGQIQGYIVEYRATDKPHQPDFTAPDDYDREEVESPPLLQENLEPGTKYEFRVAAENQLFAGRAVVLVVYTRPQADLPAPPQPISYPDDTTATTVTIGLATPASGDDFVESFVVHVKKTRSSTVTRRDVYLPIHFEDSPNDYTAAEYPKGGVPDRFVVGDANTYGGYYNAPLQTGAVYNIRVGSVSRGNESVGNVEYSEPLTTKVERPSTSVGLLVAAVVLGVGFLVAIGVASFVLWKRRRVAHAQTDEVALSENPQPRVVTKLESLDEDTAEPVVYEDVGMPSWMGKLEIKRGNLIIDDEVLGKGNFGEVRAGGVRFRGRVTRAAIKTMKESVSGSTREDFLKEIQTMASILPHPNVVGLMGACMHEGVLYVALEFLPNGNLRDYLRSIRRKEQGSAGCQDDASVLTSSKLLKFALDVAKGMVHLSNTGIIHRDLAARNILLSEDLTAKVSDFGLSRGEDVYIQKSGTRIPVRWLAIESLTRRVYKTKSDVWSFGILLWEITTYGSTPYPDIESKSLAQQLLDGYRMPKPDNCADEIYNVMMKCWQMQPCERPSFGKLVEILEELSCDQHANDYLSQTLYKKFTIKPEFDDN